MQVAKSDTIRHFNGEGLFPCAYVLLPFEYNSGFELANDGSGELTWCGRDKEQFFEWTFSDGSFSAIFNDEEYVMPTDILAEDTLLMVNRHGDRYTVVRQ